MTLLRIRGQTVQKQKIHKLIASEPQRQSNKRPNANLFDTGTTAFYHRFI